MPSKLRPWCGVGAIALAAVGLAAGSVAADPFFATKVEKYEPRRPGFYLDDPQFNNPDVALGAPVGVSAYEQDNSSVVTLGDGGSITLSFDHDVVDDPNNPGGYDFIVFSNAFLCISPVGYRCQEPAFVEISPDGINWYLMLPNKLPSQLAKSDVAQSTTVLRNYAEYTPTLGLPESRTNEEFYTIPDRQSFAGNAESLQVDAISGGGDAFDIATAVRESAPGVPAYDIHGNTIPAGITSFRWIRMTDAVRGDVWAGAEVSSEIDAVADVPPAITVGAARRLPTNNSFTVISGAKVIATFPGEFWIEQPDRSAGLKIKSDAVVVEGNVVEITGHVTDLDGDKVIEDALVTVLDKTTAAVSPIGLSGRAAASDVPQGLLVRVWGKRKTTGTGWFMLDDGSGRQVKVFGSSLPSENVFASVTGVLARDANGNPVVKTRRGTDIKF